MPDKKQQHAAVVYIVGAGPGAPDLITVRGLRAIRKSDVLICDGLLPGHFLEHLDASLHGKEIHRRGDDDGLCSQEQVNEFMLRNARQGRTVARIKTGDPHIFGRGMEELEFLARRGIRCEVIPGLTVATAFSSLTDLPATCRGQRHSLAVATARCEGGRLNEDWPRADSLVLFMGVSALETLADSLRRAGWADDTPVAILENVAMPWQRQCGGTLGRLADLAQRQDVRAPAVLVVGKAAEENRAWEMRPRILFTGLDPGSFRALGRIMHWPAIRVEKNASGGRKLPGAIRRLQEGFFAYAVFTSRTCVRMFFSELYRRQRDARLLGGAGVVACGAGTAGCLMEYGIRADRIPEGMGSEAVASALHGRRGGNVLLLQSATATEALANRLASCLGDVSRLCLHHVAPHPELGRPLPAHDVIYFTCPSGVRAWRAAYGDGAFEQEVWCIGDVTQRQLEEYGVSSKVVNPYVP